MTCGAVWESGKHGCRSHEGVLGFILGFIVTYCRLRMEQQRRDKSGIDADNKVVVVDDSIERSSWDE